MSKILCFVSADMADFEITLALHRLKNTGGRDIITAGYTLEFNYQRVGIRYLPDATLADAFHIERIEAMIIPGGPIRPQHSALTDLIRKLDTERKLLAAICNGPQYLGRAGILATANLPHPVLLKRLPNSGPIIYFRCRTILTNASFVMVT